MSENSVTILKNNSFSWFDWGKFKNLCYNPNRNVDFICPCDKPTNEPSAIYGELNRPFPYLELDIVLNKRSCYFSEFELNFNLRNAHSESYPNRIEMIEIIKHFRNCQPKFSYAYPQYIRKISAIYALIRRYSQYMEPYMQIIHS